MKSKIAAKKLYNEGSVAYNKRDYTEAVVLFQQAAKKGSADAQGLLGHMYLNGIGIQRDIDEALFWSMMGAKNDNALAQYNCGITFLAHPRVGPNDKASYVLGIYYLKKAARKGFQEAIDKLNNL